MFCKVCKLYSDRRECPKCGRLLSDPNQAQQQEYQRRYFLLIQDYCRFADAAYIWGIIAAICVTGVGAMIAAPIALSYKKKATQVKSSITSDIHEMNFSQDVMSRYYAAGEKLEKVRKCVKFALIIFFVLLFVLPIAIGIILA